MQDSQDRNVTYTNFFLTGFYGSKEWRQVLLVIFVLSISVSIPANMLLIFTIVTNRSLHSPMYILIGVMAVVDLSLPVIFVPNMLCGLLLNWNNISLIGCLLQMFCVHFAGSFQSTILLWMALDRYYAICKPLHYNDYMALSAFLKFIVIPMLRNAVFIFSVIILAGSLTFCQNEIEHCFCEHMALVTLACGSIRINNMLGLVGAFGILGTDFLIITASYVKIFVSVFKSGKSSQKALSTCITHVIVLALSIIFALTSFLSYRAKNNMSSYDRSIISILYLLFPSCFHPIIYGIRTKEIRLHIINTLKCVKVSPHH